MKRKKILIISSDPQDASAGEPVLTAAGYDVGSASSGWRALENLSETPADLLVIEVALPVMGGIELTRRLRALPNCRGARILLLGTVPAGSKLEWDAVLPKPLDAKALLATATALLA